MADINQYLRAIMEAVYGEEVRGSIHDAIDIINRASEVCISAGTEISNAGSSSEGFFDGSLYINTATDDIWKCIGVNLWEKKGNIKGVGIQSIVKTGTDVLVDTYTITYTDLSTTIFKVKNGRSINEINKTETEDLIDKYTISYNDGTTSTFNVANGKSAYRYAKDGGYPDTEEEFNTDLAKFKDYADEAKESAKDAEAWAVGQRDGADVPDTDETYENNAKYYAGEAADSESSAKDYKDAAKDSADAAAESAESAERAKEDAEDIKEEIEQMAKITEFTVDFETGELMYTKEELFEFSIDEETGNLEWEVVA